MTCYETAVFDTAEAALHWAVEVLRRRRLPRNSSLWRELVQEAEDVERQWGLARNMLIPTDPDERLGLALDIMEALAGLDSADALLLRQWSMGDWADEMRLRVALEIQERLRRQGVRVRLSYRYSYDQLSVLAKCHRKTAWRRVQKALEHLQLALQVKGVVMRVEAPESGLGNWEMGLRS